MQIRLPERVEYILSRLESAGYRADIVGGSVRDFLLGKEPGDFDITTSATPEETKAVFADERTVDTGIKHGTVTLVLDGFPYEITTYRFDGEYNDARHPSSVTFTRRIEDDLMRRDFTVNAMAYSPNHSITDLFGGREDVREGIIRAVGDPLARFSEDALRILRAVRFAATLDFQLEENTKQAIFEKMHLLGNVSAERIYVELKKMLGGSSAYSVICDFERLILEIIPELHSIILPDAERFYDAGYISRLLSIFALSASNPTAAFEGFVTRLRVDNATKNLGLTALSGIGKYDFSTERGINYAMMMLGENATRELILLEILIGKTDSEAIHRLDALISSGAAYRISDLAVGGNDLMSLGASGREIGDLLSLLLLS